MSKTSISNTITETYHNADFWIITPDDVARFLLSELKGDRRRIEEPSQAL